MGVTGMYLMSGLLAGAGKGLAEDYEAKRQSALLALKNQWDQEAADREFEQKTELVKLGSELDTEKAVTVAKTQGEETRKTRETDHSYDVDLEKVKTENDKALEKLKSGLRMTEEQAKIAAELSADITKAGKIVDHWEITADGRLVGLSATGRTITRSVNKGVFNPKNRKDDGDDEGGSIAGARDRRGGGDQPATKPKGPVTGDNASQVNYGFSAQEVTELSGLYANATPETHPQLFRNGKKIPFRDMLRMLKK